jgi:hypothetical protein
MMASTTQIGFHQVADEMVELVAKTTEGFEDQQSERSSCFDFLFLSSVEDVQAKNQIAMQFGTQSQRNEMQQSQGRQ